MLSGMVAFGMVVDTKIYGIFIFLQGKLSYFALLPLELLSAPTEHLWKSLEVYSPRNPLKLFMNTCGGVVSYSTLIYVQQNKLH